MITVLYKDWTFKVDRDATEKTYSSVLNGSTEECGCADCRNYSANKEGRFINEKHEFLRQIRKKSNRLPIQAKTKKALRII